MTRSLISFIQCWHLVDKSFTMSHTDALSQNITSLMFTNLSAQVKIQRHKAYSLRNSMLGSHIFMKSVSHSPKNQFPLKNAPKPPFVLLPDAFVKKRNLIAVSLPYTSMNGLHRILSLECDRNVSHILQSLRNSASNVTW